MALLCPATTNTISLQMPMITSSYREIIRYILVSIPVAVEPLEGGRVHSGSKFKGKTIWGPWQPELEASDHTASTLRR